MPDTTVVLKNQLNSSAENKSKPSISSCPNSSILRYLCPYLIFLLVAGQIERSLGASGNKLMVLLLDGLRWDYVKRDGLPGFQALLKSGAHVDHLNPEFPTLCYPNYYSMVTGLYPESHGMIGNNMYDSVKNEFFSRSDNASAHWWDSGEPIWVTAKKQRKKSYLFHWPGCNREIRRIKPDFCRPYFSYPSMDQYMESMVEGLKAFQNDSADFVGIYNEHLDLVGHQHGPDSPELMSTLRLIDKTVAFLLHDLYERNLRDKVNLLVISDHGMTDISPARIIDLRHYVEKRDLLQTLDGGPYTNIWPHSDASQRVYYRLRGAHPNMTVYQKHTIPEVWHYKNSHRVAPLTAVADVGWFIQTYTRGYTVFSEKKRPAKGWHGYSNLEPDMWGMFAATGPGIVQDKVFPAISMVDIYQLMCHLLHIKPSEHNGTWTHIEKMIRVTQPDPYNLHTSTNVILGQNMPNSAELSDVNLTHTTVIAVISLLCIFSWQR